MIRPEIFYQLICKPSYCNIPESRNKIKFNLYFIRRSTLNVICFIEHCVLLRVALLKVIVVSRFLENDDLIQTVGLPY